MKIKKEIEILIDMVNNNVIKREDGKKKTNTNEMEEIMRQFV